MVKPSLVESSSLSRATTEDRLGVREYKEAPPLGRCKTSHENQKTSHGQCSFNRLETIGDYFQSCCPDGHGSSLPSEALQGKGRYSLLHGPPNAWISMARVLATHNVTQAAGCALNGGPKTDLKTKPDTALLCTIRGWSTTMPEVLTRPSYHNAQFAFHVPCRCRCLLVTQGCPKMHCPRCGYHPRHKPFQVPKR